MNEQGFGEHFASSGILDGTGPAAETPVGLLSPLPENEPRAFNRPPQASVDSASVPVYDTLADPIPESIPENSKVTVFPVPEPLLDPAESEILRTRWNEIQARFVDEPRLSVQQADVLVSDVIEQITHLFTVEHSSLENQWNMGGNVSTEELRLALQHYRSFFNRLVV